MKKFELTHRFFKSEPEIFTDESPPRWFLNTAYKWWYTDHILKLKVGESIKSDFRKITRIE